MCTACLCVCVSGHYQMFAPGGAADCPWANKFEQVSSVGNQMSVVGVGLGV